MASLWFVAVPGPWLLAAAAIACAGFFMSLVNAPMKAFVMLRIPRDLRTQALAFSAVLNCVAAPIGLLLAGWALSRYPARDMIAVVFGLQSLAVLTIVGSALVERSTLQASPRESPPSDAGPIRSWSCWSAITSAAALRSSSGPSR